MNAPDVTGVGQVPTCFRHPGRETYVRCQRCDRPICPDCMRDAAVGVQCVECVRQASAGDRRPRAFSSGRGRMLVATPVTWILLAINVLLYIGERVDSTLVYRLGMIPAFVADGEPWRLLTAAFLHDPNDLLHIIFNMIALVIIGPQLEAVFGRTRFLALYLLSALAGSALGYLVEPAISVSIGASGAIFGLFGATVVVFRKLRIDTRWILFIIGINLVMTFTVSGIAWGAHIGGLVGGVLLALAYTHASVRNRIMTQVGASIGLAIIIAATVVGRTVSLLS